MASSATSQPSYIQRAINEADEVTEQMGEAFASFTWSWPFRGILFAITRTSELFLWDIFTKFWAQSALYHLSDPNIVLSVKRKVVRSTLISVAAFLFLAIYTYLPQAAFLSLFTGFLGPFLAFILVGAESVLLLILFSRKLFLEPALTQVFDATLIACGQTQLVQNANAPTGSNGSNGSVTSLGGAFVRPFQSISKGGMLKYFGHLPLNFVPVFGHAMFLFFNNQSGGSGWHARYFQLKGFDKQQKKQFVKEHQAEYTAWADHLILWWQWKHNWAYIISFGMAALLLNFIPFIGLLFTFTTAVGAALWAADLEARANLIESSDIRGDSRRDEWTIVWHKFFSRCFA